MDFNVWMGMGWCSFQYFICRKKGRSTVRNWLPRMEVSAFPFYWSDVLAEYWDFSLFNLIYFGCVLALCWRKPILYHNWWEWIFNECAIHFGKLWSMHTNVDIVKRTKCYAITYTKRRTHAHIYPRCCRFFRAPCIHIYANKQAAMLSTLKCHCCLHQLHIHIQIQ